MFKAIRLFLFLAVSTGAASFLRGTEWAIPRSKRSRFRLALQTLWAKAVWRVLRLEVTVRGTCPAGGRFLVVSNHLGYLDIACWHGEMDFAPHFWSFLGAGGARFRVRIGEPFDGGSLGRKSIAQVAHRAIEDLGKSTACERSLLPGNWIWVHSVP